MYNQKTTYHKKLLFLGAILGFLGVILGAYGAHGLKPILTSEDIETFETGIRFQFFHALLALIVGCMGFLSKKAINIIYYLLLIGVVFFSGSIYGLATNDLTSGFDFTRIALITPVGGLLLMSAWIILIANIYKYSSLKPRS
ncbi:MAG TPA: DUF423 domain-containing protein [Flavobacteriaceae bacterium]|nr:DUF423 domain-containing protein [Flavobacteriaceae bacterium]